MKTDIKSLLVLFFILVTNGTKAQIAGSFTVPGSFPTLAAAFNTLNLTGVAGAVTINVMANYTETVPLGGLKLINPPGSSTTTILFRKLGAGANPLLVAYSGGTATANSPLRDGIWMFASCKNMTVDAIDLFDPNTSAPAGMEFGYGFYKTFTGLGNRNNTIRNCVVTLSSGSAFNSHGIELTVLDYANNISSIVPTSTLDANSNNTIQKNLIQKCDIGIWMVGHNNNFVDYGNDIGGVSAVTGNTIINFGGTGSYAMGIYADNEYQMNTSYNIINNNNGFGNDALASVYGINSKGVTATMNSNTISLVSAGVTFGQPLVAISHDGYGAATGTFNVNNNIFPVLSCTASIGATNTVIASIGDNLANITNNQITNVSSDTGTITLISATGGNTAVINNNSLTGATVTPGEWITGILSSSQYQQITNNNIGNFLAPCTSNSTYNRICGISSTSGWQLTVTNNTISNIYGSDLYGVSLISPIASTSYSILNNQISNFSTAPTNTVGSTSIGILSSLSSTNSGVSYVTNNKIYNLTGAKIGNSASSQGGAVNGIWCSNGANAFVSQNKIYNLSSTGTYGVFGLVMSSAQRYIYNNLIGGLQISSDGNISALKVDNDGTSRVYFNTFYLNATASTNTTGTNLISSVNNSVIELRNNILVNTTSVSGVPSILVANNVLSTSNNNAFYCGPTGRIFWSSPSSSVISGYQSIFNSDASSFIENPPFTSTVGSNANFLNISTSVPTQIESGAVAINTITTDFINTVRSNTPDIGAWEGNYIAADASAPFIVTSGFTAPPCNGSTRTFTANITDVSGVASGSLAPRVYHRVNFNLYTSTQGVLTSGTPTNGIWTFTLNYVAVPNDVIWHFLVVQDISYLNNVRVVPSTNATVTNVNNVIVPPNPALNYTIQTFPTISLAVNNATICSGQSFVIQASGASSYSYSPGNSATVNPLVNTTYTITGASSLGCPSTNTVNLNLIALPLPTVSITGPGTICVGANATLSALGASSYTWSNGPLTNSTVVSPSSNTTYTVNGTGGNGCIGSRTISINVLSGPSLFVTTSNSVLCAGDYATINASGAISYTWSFGSNTVSTVISPSVNTTYTLSGTDANGCSSTIQFTQNVIDCTGIQESSIYWMQANIFPNPNIGSFKLITISEEGMKAEIYNLLGELIQAKELTGKETLFDLNPIPTGIYILRLVKDHEIVYKAKISVTP